MDRNNTLKGIVARIGGIDPGGIGQDFSLRTARFQGSIRRAALIAAIRRELGVDCPLGYAATTFGELEHAVFGTAAATGVENLEKTARVVAAKQNDPDFAMNCGVDIEMVSGLPEAADFREHEFYQQFFSPEEMAYCLIQENPRMHLAARWCAKEALHKCDAGFRSEKMSNIEVVRTDQGAVFFRHRTSGTARTLPHSVSMAHTESIAIAFVVKPCDASASKPAASEPNPPAAPAAGALAAADGNRYPVLLVVGWLLAMAASILALVRTYK